MYISALFTIIHNWKPPQNYSSKGGYGIQCNIIAIKRNELMKHNT